MATSSIPAGQSYIAFISPDALQEVPVSTSTVHDILIPMYAALYGVSAQTMDTIVKGESDYCEYQFGDHDTSFGCVQIHLPAHPDITRAEALNVFFSLNYLAQQLSEGHCVMWSTCPLAVNSP